MILTWLNNIELALALGKLQLDMFLLSWDLLGIIAIMNTNASIIIYLFQTSPFI